MKNLASVANCAVASMEGHTVPRHVDGCDVVAAEKVVGVPKAVFCVLVGVADGVDDACDV